MNSKENLGGVKLTLVDAPVDSIRVVLQLSPYSYSLQSLIDVGVQKEIIRSWIPEESSSVLKTYGYEGLSITKLNLLEQICFDYGMDYKTSGIERDEKVAELQERITKHLDKSVPAPFAQVELPGLKSIKKREDTDGPKITLADVSVSAIREIIYECSGASFFPVPDLIEKGIPEEVVDSLIKIHETKTEKPLPKIMGRNVPLFYDLDLLISLCHAYGLDFKTKYGERWDRAEELKARISNHLDTPLPQAFKKFRNRKF
ncbi:MAG: hypothetical protein Q8P80_02675 [Candidatus Levybacteria bacterium]|nr:hypothetical protein [Candidatus Levybacteria bacterium]